MVATRPCPEDSISRIYPILWLFTSSNLLFWDTPLSLGDEEITLDALLCAESSVSLLSPFDQYMYLSIVSCSLQKRSYSVQNWEPLDLWYKHKHLEGNSTACSLSKITVMDSTKESMTLTAMDLFHPDYSIRYRIPPVEQASNLDRKLLWYQ